MPEIEQLYQQYKDKVDIIGVSMGPRDEPAGVAQFVDLNKYHWQFIHDADSSVMNNYLVTGIPSSFFIDKNGVIRSISRRWRADSRPGVKPEDRDERPVARPVLLTRAIDL